MALEEKTEFGTAAQLISVADDFTTMKRESLVKVDLACGQNKADGYIGIDNEKLDSVDIVHNLSIYPWPFSDNSIYEFRCSHYVEHCRDLVKFMEEAWRCLIPGGIIDITAPYYSSIRAWQDPTHVRGITEITFLYFCRELTKASKLDHYTGRCNFEVMTKVLHFNVEYESRSTEAREYAMRHFINVVDDIQFILRKIEL